MTGAGQDAGDGPGTGSSRWRVHGERALYESPWVRLHLIDVEQPGGARYEHHAVRSTADAVACVVRRGDGPAAEVLLLWRHRVVTDAWGWEVPAGRVEPGEPAVVTAARETTEETGWEVTDVREVLAYHPVGGSGDQRFVVCTARAVREVGAPDPTEADRVEWVPVRRLASLVADGQVPEGLTLVALLLVLSGLSGVAAFGGSEGLGGPWSFSGPGGAAGRGPGS